MKRKKILITTGVYPPQIGGPAQYAKSLREAFIAMGHDTRVVTYGWERALPIGLRHGVFFLKILLRQRGVDRIIALDTFSVGLPSVWAGKIFRKKVIIRVGGDFLWESYVKRTKKKVTLRAFYKSDRDLTLKERIISRLTRYLLQNADKIVFSTLWIQDIFIPTYSIDPKKTYIIENFYGEKFSLDTNEDKQKKVFLSPTRSLYLKNKEALQRAFKEAKKVDPNLELDEDIAPHDELLEKMKQCYAVVLPSLSEVSPNLILEAIRFNKPFILTQETGFYEKMKDIGIFIDPLSEDDIREKILFLADDENYRKYKKKIEEFTFVHSWEEIAHEFLTI